MTYPGAMAVTGVLFTIATIVFGIASVDSYDNEAKFLRFAKILGLIAFVCFFIAAWWQAITDMSSNSGY